jgi:hypothetical protein
MSANGWRVCWIEAAFGTSLDQCVRQRDAIKGFLRGSEISRENVPAVNRQGSIQPPPEFGLNSLKG